MSSMLPKSAAIVLSAVLMSGSPALFAAPATPVKTEPPQDGKMPHDLKQVPAYPAEKKTPIDQKLQEEARGVIAASLQSGRPHHRAHALEAARQLYGEKAKDEIVRAMRDPEAVVPLSAVMAAGDTQLKELHEDVIKLIDDNDPGVRVAVRYAVCVAWGTRVFAHSIEAHGDGP